MTAQPSTAASRTTVQHFFIFSFRFPMHCGGSVPKIRRLHPSCVGLLPACGVPGIWDRAGRAEPWAGSRRDAELSCRKSFCCLMQAPNYLGCDLSRAVPGKNARRAAVPTPPGWEWRAQPAWPLGENMFGFVLSGAVLPRHLESTPLRLGGWVPGEQLWVFFSEDRLQLRFWGSCAVPCHLRVSADEMGTAPCREAGAVPRVLAASEPLPITLKKIPQGFFLSALGRRWHPAHPNGDRAAYLRRGRRPGPHYQRPQPHHSPRLGLSELCRAGGGQRDEPWAGCPAGLSQRGLRAGGGHEARACEQPPRPRVRTHKGMLALRRGTQGCCG